MINKISKYWMMLAFASITFFLSTLSAQADSFAQIEFDANRSAAEPVESMVAPSDSSQIIVPESRAKKFKKRTRRNLFQKLYAGNPARVGSHVGILSYLGLLCCNGVNQVAAIGWSCMAINLGCFLYDLHLCFKDNKNNEGSFYQRIYKGRPARIAQHCGIVAISPPFIVIAAFYMAIAAPFIAIAAASALMFGEISSPSIAIAAPVIAIAAPFIAIAAMPSLMFGGMIGFFVGSVYDLALSVGTVFEYVSGEDASDNIDGLKV